MPTKSTESASSSAEATTSSPSPSHTPSSELASLPYFAEERQHHPRTLRVGALTIDLSARAARVHGNQLTLSAKEYALLVALAHDPHHVFTKAELLQAVWGYRTPSRTIDSHASRLRQKLAAHGQRLVINVWGVGYCLAPAWRVDNEVVR